MPVNIYSLNMIKTTHTKIVSTENGGFLWTRQKSLIAAAQSITSIVVF